MKSLIYKNSMKEIDVYNGQRGEKKLPDVGNGD